MITEHDLKEAIAECEGQRNPNANTCLKLAAFYTIQDKMFPQSGSIEPEPVFYSRAAAPEGKTDYLSETEFGRAVHGMDYAVLVPVVDELMSTLEVVCPRIYRGVLRKLAEL